MLVYTEVYTKSQAQVKEIQTVSFFLCLHKWQLALNKCKRKERIQPIAILFSRGVTRTASMCLYLWLCLCLFQECEPSLSVIVTEYKMLL